MLVRNQRISDYTSHFEIHIGPLRRNSHVLREVSTSIFQWELCQPRPVADLRLWQGPGTCAVRKHSRFGGFLQVTAPHSANSKLFSTSRHTRVGSVSLLVLMGISACIQFVWLKAPKTTLVFVMFIQDLEDVSYAIGFCRKKAHQILGDLDLSSLTGSIYMVWNKIDGSLGKKIGWVKWQWHRRRYDKCFYRNMKAVLIS